MHIITTWRLYWSCVDQVAWEAMGFDEVPLTFKIDDG